MTDERDMAKANYPGITVFGFPVMPADAQQIADKVNDAIRDSDLMLGSSETTAWVDAALNLNLGVSRAMFAPPQIDWTAIFRRVPADGKARHGSTDADHVYALLRLGMSTALTGDGHPVGFAARRYAGTIPLPPMVLPALMELRRPFTPRLEVEDAASLLSLNGIALAIRSGQELLPYEYRTGLTYRFDVPEADNHSGYPATFDLHRLHEDWLVDSLRTDRLVWATKKPAGNYVVVSADKSEAGDFPIHLTTVAGVRHVVVSASREQERHKAVLLRHPRTLPDLFLCRNVEPNSGLVDEVWETVATLYLPRIGYSVRVMQSADGQIARVVSPFHLPF